MAKRLDLDDEEIADLFGVDVEPRKTSTGKREDRGIKVKVKDDKSHAREHQQVKGGGYIARVERIWAGVPAAAKWGTGGIVVGGALAILFGRVGRAVDRVNEAPSVPPTPPPAPPPPAPAEKTAHAGASLRVVHAGPVNLRAVAGKRGAVVGMLGPGAGVTVETSVLAEGERWYKVRTHDGREGWVHGGMLG